VEFIGEAGPEALLCGVWGAYHGNIFIARSRFGLSNGAFYAIGHESEG
jgi:hypothetical protein